jgi:hypothetical protein
MKETDYPQISVSFTEEEFTIVFTADDEVESSWSKTFEWVDINRICLKTYDYGAPHFLYIEIPNVEEDIIVPITKTGGEAFLEELINRRLVTRNQIDITLANLKSVHIKCWPDKS